MKKHSLSKATKLLGINSFFTDVSTEMIVPLLPLFITHTLGASALVLGFIEGWAELCVSVMDILSGRFSDKYKRRKPFVIFGYSLSAIMKPIFAFASNWPQLFVFRFLERMGKGIRRSPRDAMIASREKDLGAAFGFRKMMDSAGALLGPILSAILLFYLSGTMSSGEIYRTIFLLSVIPAAIGVALLFLVKEKKKELAKIRSTVKLLSRDFSHFLFVAAFFSLAQMGIAFFILRASESLSILMVPIVYLAYNAVYTVFAMPAGLLTDFFGAKRMLIFAYFLFALICITFAFFGNPGTILLFILFGLLGIFMAIMQTTPRVFLVQSAPGHKYASAIGTYQGITGLLLFPANLIAGLLWGTSFLGLSTPFFFSAAIALIAGFVLLLAVKGPISPHKNTTFNVVSN